MFEQARYQLASLLAPELADCRKRHANAQAEVETLRAIQKADVSAYDDLARRWGDANNRLIEAGLKLNRQQAALKVAKAYVDDALDDAVSAAEKATVKRRTAAEVTVFAVRTDLSTIAEALK